VEFTAEVDVRPNIELPMYKGRSVQVADVEVTEADIDEQLDELRTRFASVAPVERATAADDLVVVDVEGLVDGERRDEFSGTAMTFEVGAGKMIEGFDDAVIGASAGDTVTFVHVPTEGDFAGAEVELTVSVKAVRERTLPDPDDDFAQLASEFDTIDELRDDLKARLARVKLVEQGIEARDLLAADLLEEADVPVPEGVLAQLVDQHFSDGHGDEEHRDQFVEDTTKTLRQQFLLDAIADAEGVEVGQDDIGQWLMQQAPRYQMTPDQFLQALMQADQLSSAIGDVRRGKALSLVLENAVITDASGRPVDLSALDEQSADADEVADDAAADIDEVADDAALDAEEVADDAAVDAEEIEDDK
jgi:trigger factor